MLQATIAKTKDRETTSLLMTASFFKNGLILVIMWTVGFTRPTVPGTLTPDCHHPPSQAPLRENTLHNYYFKEIILQD